MFLNAVFYDPVINSILSDDFLLAELMGIMDFDSSFTFSHARTRWIPEFWRILRWVTPLNKGT